MIIKNNGNVSIDGTTFNVDAVNNRVGIGVTGPGGTLDIKAAASTHPLIVQGPSSEFARVDSSGRLLVGTSTSVENVGGNIQVNGGNATINTFVANSAAYRLYFVKSRSGTFNGKAIVQSDDDLGRISFNGDDGVDYSSEAASIACQVDGTPGSNDMPGRLVFSTTADGGSSPTERMRITENGNTRIGRTTAYSGERLCVANTLNQTNASMIQDYNGNVANLICIHTYARVAQSATQIQFQDYNGLNVGSITNNTATVAYNTTSDYRLKENIEPTVDGIARLQQLKPSRFNFISDPSTVVDGFIAHEVQGVVPEAIHGTKDEVDADGKPVYQGIDQSKLVPLLTAALQEAIGEIESLKARLTAAGI